MLGGTAVVELVRQESVCVDMVHVWTLCCHVLRKDDRGTIEVVLRTVLVPDVKFIPVRQSMPNARRDLA
jgi:hypothetical protein